MAWIPNVNPNELIESAWGNTIRDHVVNVFASAAERDIAIPTPFEGQTCYVTAAGLGLMSWTTKVTPSGWRLPWNLPWGTTQTLFPPDATNVVGAIFLPGATATLVPNRKNLVTVTGMVQKADSTIGTGTLWLQQAGTPDHSVRASMQNLPGWSVPFIVRHHYATGTQTNFGASCDQGPMHVTQIVVTVQDGGPA